MCVIWTQKYHICGCIWNTQDLYCEPTELCWGARMILVHCYLQTCKECWKNGDKRVDQEVANLLAQHEAERRPRGQEREEELSRDENDGDSDSDPDSGEENFEAIHPSRPTTPELDPNLQKRPRWLFGLEVMGDATRACEPVKPEMIWKDYRARRGRTDWYMVEGKSRRTLCLLICSFCVVNEYRVLIKGFIRSTGRVVRSDGE